MALRFFSIPVRDSQACEQELNGFLSSRKILSIDRHFVEQGSNSFWALCIDYLTSTSSESSRPHNLARNRVDYKTILSPDEFGVFSRLRDIRKELAQSEAVPVYALFTNEQLAQMVQRRCRTNADLAQIEGIGEAKVSKYSEHILRALMALKDIPDAASNESV